MAVGRLAGIAATVLLGSMNLGCERYYEHFLFVATPEKINERKLKPLERRAALRDCIASNSLYISSDFTRDISEGENIRMGHYAARCYHAYVHSLTTEPVASADERAATALAAERSILAVDPDPKARLDSAAYVAEVAAEALKEKNDPAAVSASLRAAWYASRSRASEVGDAAAELWAGVRAADDSYIQARLARQAAMNAAVSQAASNMRSAMLANANLKPAQRQQLEQQQRMERAVAGAIVAFANFSRELSESRADLRVLLKAGVESIPDLLPDVEKRLVKLKSWSAANEIVATLDAVHKNERGASERLFVSVARSLGAEVPMPKIQKPPPEEPPDPPVAATPPPTPGATASPAAKTSTQKLTELNELLEKGLIKQSEFDEQRKRILEEIVK
jgi:hypothetical protein